jgi:hypothetical protein
MQHNTLIGMTYSKTTFNILQNLGVQFIYCIRRMSFRRNLYGMQHKTIGKMVHSKLTFSIHENLGLRFITTFAREILRVILLYVILLNVVAL